MQFRGEHLQDLIGRKGGQRQGQEFLKNYTSLINLIAKGNELPNEYSQFLSSCQAVPIPKGVNAIRPIAMPHLSRKITEKCLARIYSGQFEKHFQGLQFGVATPSGSEKLVHELLDHQYSNADHDIIVLDSENAFNNQNRDVMFMEIKKYFPELLPYVTSIYNCPNFLFINGDNGKIHTMQSTMGAHQGAPLGSMLYSAGQQEVIRQIQEMFDAGHGGKIRAFIDDITLQGTPQGLCNAVQHILHQGETFGIRLNFNKVKIYIGDCSTEEAQQRMQAYQQLFDNSVPMHHISLPSDAAEARGIEVLNVPLGSDEYVKKQLSNKSKEIEADIDLIASLTNAQEKWAYTFYILTGKFTYLYRTVRNYKLTIPIALAFGSKRKTLVEQIVDAKLTKLFNSSWVFLLEGLDYTRRFTCAELPTLLHL